MMAADAGTTTRDLSAPHAVAPEYPRNGEGQSYGSVMQAPRPDLEPDLILVETTDGKTGYARKVDMDGPNFKSPEAALAWQRAHANAARRIPVFNADGMTVIGQFVIGGEGTSTRETSK